MPGYYDIKDTLLGVEPAAWRGFQLHDEATFAELHEALQVACGWRDCHMHLFAAGDEERVLAGMAEDEADVPDEEEVPLARHFKPGERGRCHYLYDFGDEWRHELVVEHVVLDDVFERRLLDGARCFPPEDSGGAFAYQDYVALLKKPAKKRDADERERLLWWSEYDPESFSVAELKARFDLAPPRLDPAVVGRWRLEWQRDAGSRLDLEGLDGSLTLLPTGGGLLELDELGAELEAFPAQLEGQPAVELAFLQKDEEGVVSGWAFAALEGEGLSGRLHIFGSGRTRFTGRRETRRRPRRR